MNATLRQKKFLAPSVMEFQFHVVTVRYPALQPLCELNVRTWFPLLNWNTCIGCGVLLEIFFDAHNLPHIMANSRLLQYPELYTSVKVYNCVKRNNLYQPFVNRWGQNPNNKAKMKLGSVICMCNLFIVGLWKLQPITQYSYTSTWQYRFSFFFAI